MKLQYRPGSSSGTWLSTSFQKSLVIDILNVTEQTSSGKGMIHPMFETPAFHDHVGRPEIHLSLPTPSHPTCEIGLTVSIPTQTQGVFDRRKITKAEIRALRDAWPIIRQEAIDDAFTEGEDIEHLFARIDCLMVAKQVKIYTPNKDDPASMRLQYVGKPPAPTPIAKDKPIVTETQEEKKTYAVSFAYSERGRYSDEAPTIWALTDTEKDILTTGVVDKVYGQEELDELHGKFYRAAELLQRVQERDHPSLPTTIHESILIWLQ